MNQLQNHHNFDTALDQVRAVGMSPAERAIIQARILSTAPAHTGAEKISGAAPARLHSPLSYVSFIVGTFAAVVLLAGGAFVTAAENALPGDQFYDMKVGVLEPMRAGFMHTSEAVAHFESSLVNTRLHEAETLATAGKLNDAKREEIEALLDKHTASFNQALAGVEAQSPEKAGVIASAFKATVELHSRIMSQFIAVASTTGKDVEAVQHLKAGADSHVKDLRARWTMPLPATTSEDFIMRNTAGSDLTAAAAGWAASTSTPGKLPIEAIDQASPQPNPAIYKKKIK